MWGQGDSLAASTRSSSGSGVRRSVGNARREEKLLPSNIQPDIDIETMKNLAEMGFSKERVSRAKHELPSGMSPSFENLLQALFEQSVTPLSSRPPSASLVSMPSRPPPYSSTPVLNATSEVPKAMLDELIQMGFSRDAVYTVTANMNASVSLEQALEVLLSFQSQAHGEPEQEDRASDIAVRASMHAVVGPSSDTRAEQRQVLFDYIVASQEGVDTEDVWRLLLLTDAALSQKLITDEQHLELCQELQNLNLCVVKDFLAIIQVRNERGMPLNEKEPLWECSICFSEQAELGWRCPEGHQYCHTCMGHHVEATTFPNCPHVGCGFQLEEPDLLAIQVPKDRLESFQEAKLRNAVDSIGAEHDQEGCQEVVIHCQRRGCANAQTVFVGAPRLCYACPCGAPSFCTQCRQTPYHFHAECSQVQTIREDYLEWVSQGRESYFNALGMSKKFVGDLERFQVDNKLHQSQIRSLKDSILRHRELESDEVWKAKHCRLCPGCRRPIEKTDGCDSMVCGKNYHGGNDQPGCGCKFNWGDAAPYIAVAKAMPDSSGIPSKPRAPHQREIAKRGVGAFHPFVDCSLCGSKGIEGPCFRCIHCESFSICSLCEPRASTLHSADHVFEIMYESTYDWSQVPLPVGLFVRVARCKDRMPPHGLEGFIGQISAFHPLVRGSIAHRQAVALGQKVPVGYYDVTISDGGIRTETLSAEFVEPSIDSRKKAELLIDGKYEVEKN